MRGLVCCSGEVSPHRKQARKEAIASEMDNNLCHDAGIAGLRHSERGGHGAVAKQLMIVRFAAPLPVHCFVKRARVMARAK